MLLAPGRDDMTMNDPDFHCDDSRPADLSVIGPSAARVAEALRAGYCPADRAFDRFLPPRSRQLSSQYWTPLSVATRAAGWFEDLGIRTVVDIGSGAGKFCVAVGLASSSR